MPKIQIHGKGATKLRKLAINAIKEVRQVSQTPNHLDHQNAASASKDYGNNNDYSYRNFHQNRTQNHTQLETLNQIGGSYLPQLKSPSVTLQQSLIEIGVTSPPPLMCKKYHKIVMLTQRNSPARETGTSQLSTHTQHYQDVQDALVYQNIAAMHNHHHSLVGASTLKNETFNRAMYHWNHWNVKDESSASVQGGFSKHKIRDQLQIMKEERRIQKYHQELMSLQRKRRIIEQYQTEYNGKLQIASEIQLFQFVSQ